MVKKTLIQLYRIIFWILGIALALMLIIALAIQFIVFPNINQYKDDIAQYLSGKANQKIVIGEILVDWKKFDPHLSLSNITLFDAQNRPALQLNNTEVLVSWLSLLKLEPHLAELRLQTPELTVRRLKNGEIFVAGISTQGTSKPELANWLLRQSKLKVKNAKIVWIDERRNAPPLSLNQLNLEVLSPPWKSILKQHRLSISAVPSVGTKTPVTLYSQFYGNDISQLEKWHGDLTMHLRNAQIPDFNTWLDFPFLLHAAAGNAAVFLTFNHNKIQSVKANLNLNHINLKLKPTLPNVLLDVLAGEIDWDETPIKKSLVLKNVQISQQDLHLKNIQASISEDLANKNHLQTVNLSMDEVDLSNIHHLSSLLPIAPEQLEHINGLAPKGKVNKISFSWLGKALNEKTITQAYEIKGKFNGLSINAYQNTPGFTNFTGELNADEKNGSLKLSTEKASVDFKEVLRFPTPIDKLNGLITWNVINKNNQTSVRINTHQLNIENPHLRGFLHAKLLVDDKGETIDLTGQFNKIDLKFASNYYPKILNDDTLNWLDNSILSGSGENIKVTLKGNLSDFPFVDANDHLDPKKGLFRVTADIKDGVIEYNKDWPRVEEVDLKMLFEGNRMVLKANKGRQLGNQITQATITIPHLDSNEPELIINGNVEGPVSEGVLFINKSPVSALTQGFTDHLKASGNGQLSLNLSIPLNHAEDAKVKGIYQMTNASLVQDDLPDLSQINGSLEFTEHDLNASNVKGISFGAPLVANISSGQDKLIRVNVKGKSTPELISHYIPNSQHFISGSSEFSADIVIQKPQVSLNIRSDLLGIISYLPAPLNKAANVRLPIMIDKKDAQNGELININIGQILAAKISSKFERGESQLDNINIRFSQGNSGLADNTLSNNGSLINNSKGLYVRGELDYLDLDAWRAVVKDLTSTGSTSSVMLPVQKIAVKINTLDAFGRRFNQLNLSNKANKEGFVAVVDSREITGDLQWQNQSNGKLIARLTHLMIPDDSPKSTYANPLLPVIVVNKASAKLNQIYPSLDVTAHQFDFKGKSMGGLELVADPQDNNWNIEKFKLINADSTISADGAWSNVYTNPMTRFNVVWEIQDLGKTLQRLGYPDTIKGGEGELKGQLNWSGSPHEFDVLALNGNLKFEVRQGEVLKVQSGVGRLLGLVTLQSLPRRLTLDFKDLFSNGFAFDKIKARVSIDKGIMRSDNFNMTGPAADVDITGETNLKMETQKLKVKVYPHISDSLSLAALAGGPLVGAVAFLAQKVLKDPLNQIASTEYDIIGTWDNPQEVASEKKSQEKPPNIMTPK